MATEVDVPFRAGAAEWRHVIAEIRIGRFTEPEDIAEYVGMKGLNWLIEGVLEAHYPPTIFPTQNVLWESWGGEHAGEDIDPGRKWIAALRLALEVIERAERE